MDDLIKDLQLFSSVLAKLGYADKAGEVDVLTSDVLLNVKQTLDDGTTIKPHQRKALLIKAKARVTSLQEKLGDLHAYSPSLARISYELRREIEES